MSASRGAASSAPHVARAAAPRRATYGLGLILALAAGAPAPSDIPDDSRGVVIVAPSVRDAMNAIFVDGNRHWNELAEVNTLTQMLGSGRPTQREYLGCLRGRIGADTVWVTGWMPAQHMRRLQFAVTGSCDSIPDLIGTWHTHPFRADPDGRPLKERALSARDLDTFTAGGEHVALAVWDVDSLDSAVRTADGVRHPAHVVVR